MSLLICQKLCFWITQYLIPESLQFFVYIMKCLQNLFFYYSWIGNDKSVMKWIHIAIFTHPSELKGNQRIPLRTVRSEKANRVNQAVSNIWMTLHKPLVGLVSNILMALHKTSVTPVPTHWSLVQIHPYDIQLPHLIKRYSVIIWDSEGGCLLDGLDQYEAGWLRGEPGCSCPQRGPDCWRLDILRLG